MAMMTSIQRQRFMCSLILLLCQGVSAAAAAAAESTGAGFLRGGGSRDLEKNSNWVEDSNVMDEFVGPVINMTTQKGSKDKDDGSFLEISPRIVHGVEASSPYSFYVMLLIQVQGEYRWAGCGATLVSNCHVVTAAHCISMRSTFPVSGIFVNAHTPFQGNGEDPFHFSLVEHTEMHPDFEARTNHGDIAVLTMSQCLDVTEFPPALIPQAQDEAPFTANANNNNANNHQQQPTMVQVMGFGSTSGESNIPASTLQKAVVPFISRQKCRSYYGNSVMVDQICAGFAETGGADACQGDSGSGLVHFGKGKPYLVGIVSWGIGCGEKYHPGVYIYVPYYRAWVMERICGQNPNSNQQPWCFGITAYRGENATNNNGIVGLAPQQQQGQQQQQQQEQQPQCKGAGAVCLQGGECCSDYCRAFPGTIYRKCTGELPGRQPQRPRERQGQEPASDTTTYKRGGAGGARHYGDEPSRYGGF